MQAKRQKSRQNIMRMEANKKDYWWGPLTFLVLSALVIFGIYCLSTGRTLDGVALIVGVLISKLGTLIDFRYGSSQGSKSKTDLLAKNETGN